MADPRAGQPRRHGRVRRRLRYAAACSVCDARLSQGVEAVWDFDHSAATCLACADGVVAVDGASTGVAGRSARDEGERRRSAQASEVAKSGGAARQRRRPRLLGGPGADGTVPDPGASWEKGAVGEEQLGRALDRLAGTRTDAGAPIAVLHDRQVPRSRANIDHIVVTAAGVWVVDAKHYRGLLEIEERAPGDVRLVVDGRDHTGRLVAGASRQAGNVRRALDESGAYRDVPVQAALCFIDPKKRRRSRSATVDGVVITWEKDLLRRVTGSGRYDQAWRQSIQNHLATRFRPAGRPGR